MGKPEGMELSLCCRPSDIPMNTFSAYSFWIVLTCLFFLGACGDVRDYASMAPQWERTFSLQDRSKSVRVYGVLRKDDDESVFAQFLTINGATKPVQISQTGACQRVMQVGISDTWARIYVEFHSPFRGKIELKDGAWTEIAEQKIKNPEEVRSYKYSVFAYAGINGAVKTGDDLHSTPTERASGMFYMRERLPEVENIDGEETAFKPAVCIEEKVYPEKSGSFTDPRDERPILSTLSIIIEEPVVSIVINGTTTTFPKDTQGISRAKTFTEKAIKNYNVQAVHVSGEAIIDAKNLDGFGESIHGICSKNGRILFTRSLAPLGRQDSK